MDKKLANITPKTSGSKAVTELEIANSVEELQSPVVTLIQEEVKEEPLKYSALSIVPVFEDGYRFLALMEIKFDPNTNRVGEIIELNRGTRDEIEFLFKTTVIDRGIFN